MEHTNDSPRLRRIRAFLDHKKWKYTFFEEDGLGSVNFEARGLSYHVWEFFENGEYGAESNVRTTGRQEDFLGDYEEDILNILHTWH